LSAAAAEKLTQGLAFLDYQAPELQVRVVGLQDQLATFRQRSGFVEPTEMAKAKGHQDAAGKFEQMQKNLDQKQARLLVQAQALSRGQLITNDPKSVAPPEAASPMSAGGSGQLGATC
jgi:hypothetical protein